ncbi:MULTISPECIES: DinB family protein [Streptomyces]|uniref:DinB family protein n=2 Tax=Streptomyces griseoaurantiacus TaxID=68213 RepID=A0A7W2DXL1_9ACTN|nr:MULTISPECIES: DinB family protein [Streptomyces]MBA5224885.1 DinB family protein [Streptomyces griseoaurantiacus]MDX3088686.1 DinB family protein [Streptomyces sp. ME12-02E]MDX3331798.1 DinB family protein [Streptomyces sp. ME02-6978a]WTI24988.1 DinB family protein [Streptomyces jietaisiensis]
MTNEVTGPVAGSEVGALLRALDGQRRHVLGALDGLAEEDLRRPVLPSGWHCLGLVRHLTLDVERFWFRAVLAGEEEVIRTLPSGDEAWQVAPETAAADVLDRYRREAELADALITATPAEAPLAWWPHELFGAPHLHTLRDVLLHVITETACHAGHLDAARELIDGRRWLVLT